MSVHTFETMGTVASLRLRELGAHENAEPSLTAVRGVFDRYDEMFSLYRADSEVSRIARGELSLTESSESVRHAYAECIEWRNATGGAFTPHRPDGVIDLSGLIKAQAMSDAAALLDRWSPAGWLLDVGGDILTSPERGPDARPWSIGIVDPDERTALLCSLPLAEGWAAVATSGIAERGEHIWRSDSAGEFTQVSVFAGDIVTADVLATAILSGGQAQLDLATRAHPIDVLTVGRRGELQVTGRLRLALGAAAETSGAV